MAKAKDITGRVFGRWTVRCLAPKRVRSTEAFWECVCSCGKVGLVSSHRLKTGKSSGCLSCSKRKRPFESMYNYVFQSAVKRHLDFELTYDSFLGFTMIGICHYCNDKVAWVKFGTDGKGTNPYNLDRKDNTKGYTVDNLVVCCKVCNKVKSNQFSYEEMVEIGKTIRSLREKIKGAVA